MKIYRTVPSLLAAVLAISLSGSGAAVADDSHRYYDRHDYGSHQDRRAYANKQDRRHYKQDRRHYKQDRHHYKQQKKHYYNRHNYAYRYDDDNDEKLLIGLVLGGLIGYAINNAYDPDIYGD
jgi:hypothetical protein